MHLQELWDLFWTFTRIGGLTFGGGYAMLPLMQKEIVDRRGWASDEEMIDYYAIAQCIPGIIAINTATFVGYDRRGAAGAVAATLGMVFPSIVIITAIASFIHLFEDLPLLQNAFTGVRVAVTALIIGAVVKMWQTSVVDWAGVALFVAALLLIFFVKLSPIIVILAAAGIGIWLAKKGFAAEEVTEAKTATGGEGSGEK